MPVSAATSVVRGGAVLQTGGVIDPSASTSASRSRAGGRHARALVALGSNEGDRLALLQSAAAQIRGGALPVSWLASASAIYETHPVGPTTKVFLNAAIELRTAAEPVELLDALLEIERAHGRIRGEKFADRTLDLDLLMVLMPTETGFEPLQMSTTRLVLPHPRMLERDFVLAPLADLLRDEPLLDGPSAKARLAALRRDHRSVISRLDTPLLPPLHPEPFEGDWD
jgi:2-amino-4-hydroxy-6-hydroxymethyldihydropteridine diphosphokinase